MLSSSKLYTGKVDEALTEFEKALAEDPDNYSLQVNTANVNLLNRNFQRAKILACEVLQTKPRDGTAMSVLLQASFIIDGSSEVESLVAANPWIKGNRVSSGALALIYQKDNRLTEAIELLRIHAPGRIHSLYDAHIVIQLATAIASSAHATIQRDLPTPSNLPAGVVASLRECEHLLDTALAFLKTSDVNNFLATAFANRATVRVLLMNWQGALSDAQRAYELDDDNPYVRTNLARTQFYTGSIHLALETLKDVPPAKRVYGENSLLAEIYISQQNVEKAIPLLETDLQEALDMNQWVGTVIMLLAVYNRVGNTAAIRDLQKQVEQRAPEDPYLNAMVGLALASDAPEEAEALILKSLEKDSPRSKMARRVYVDFLKNQGRPLEAAKEFEPIVAASENEGEHYELVGLFFLGQDFHRAAEAARRYREKHGCNTDLPLIEATSNFFSGELQTAFQQAEGLIGTPLDDGSPHLLMAQIFVAIGQKSSARQVILNGKLETRDLSDDKKRQLKFLKLSLGL